MQRRHEMPFGAACLDDGGVRFRLWAPAARRVELCLAEEEGRVVLPMAAGPEGWFELVSDRARAGSCYGYRIDGADEVPDPASRFQPRGVHGLSQVVDPRTWSWRDGNWRGRPWEEAVIYEVHVGCFTPPGTLAALTARLDYLVELGVTALELMPLAAFPGRRNWGYDGVLPYAPADCYGAPEDLKLLVESAHQRQLMVLLDVVYNHFGPEGNYLHGYAPHFFTARHQTPWGDALNFAGAASSWVRRFFIENALYWLNEYHFDGLRLDAVHAIHDDSNPHLLVELAQEVRACCDPERRVHLILENDANQARYLGRDPAGRPRLYNAQWNDDWHHAAHVLATGETEGYYADYACSPLAQLGRCLSEGFAFQGEPSPFRRGQVRGEPSRELPPAAFVNFLQNHDQVGNRALGERLNRLAAPEVVRALSAVLLLAPSPPLLFMGQEWGATTPFLFFADFGPELARLVSEGRRREFADFAAFATPEQRRLIPDPEALETFAASVLVWDESQSPAGRQWLDFHRRLLALRRREIIPLVARLANGAAGWRTFADRGLQVVWPFGDGKESLVLLANLGPSPAVGPRVGGRLWFALPAVVQDEQLPPWSVRWLVGEDVRL
jgi:maltooligosyltrehalose trehalohydrolase